MTTRGERVMDWIERFCCEPEGRYKGQRMRLSPEQQAAVLRIYNDGQQPDEPVRGRRMLGAGAPMLADCQE